MYSWQRRRLERHEELCGADHDGPGATEEYSLGDQGGGPAAEGVNTVLN